MAEPQKLYAELRTTLKDLIQDEGFSVDRLMPLIDRYGPAEVMTALQSHGTTVVTGKRVFVSPHRSLKKAAPATAEGDQPVPPLSSQGTKPIEVGTKRTWGDYTMEKRADGRWHVIGAKKDATKGNPAQASTLSDQDAKSVISKLRSI